MLMFATSGISQGFEVGIFTQNTVAGYQQGVEFSVIKKRHELGLHSFRSNKVSGENMRNFEDLSYGVKYSYTLHACDRLQLRLGVKGAVMENRFLVVLPQAETNIKIFNNLWGTLITGMRYGQPALGLKAFYKL